MSRKRSAKADLDIPASAAKDVSDQAAPGSAWKAASGLTGGNLMTKLADTLGEPPMAYVTAWRMDLAARLVRERGLPLARVAERVGYQSEAAFNRAFRRAHGMTPGAFARRDPAELVLPASYPVPVVGPHAVM